MIYPAGILTNTATGRFHPIIFRMAPMPGNADERMIAQRYKSLGHHTVGFETIDEAKAHIAAKRDDDTVLVDSGQTWEWDGDGMPAMVEFFNLAQLMAK